MKRQKYQKTILIVGIIIIMINAACMIIGLFTTDMYYTGRFGIGVTRLNNGGFFEKREAFKTDEDNGKCYKMNYIKIFSFVISFNGDLPDKC